MTPPVLIVNAIVLGFVFCIVSIYKIKALILAKEELQKSIISIHGHMGK